MLMGWQTAGRIRRRRGDAIQAGGQHGSDRFVGASLVVQRPLRRGLHAIRPIVRAQSQEAEASAIALLGMGPAGQDALHDLGRGRAGLRRPCERAGVPS